MKGKKLATVLLMLALIVPLTVTAQDPSISTSGSFEGQRPIAPSPLGPEDVLWDQYNNWSGTDFAAQDFETSYDAYDIWAGDDFENAVPWTIGRIVSRGGWGTYVNLANATAISWYICADAGGVAGCVPGDGSEFWTLSLPPSDPQVTLSMFEAEDFVVDLDTPIDLPAGTWWIIFQVSLEYGLYGQYGISSTADPAWGSPAKQINPNGGFGYGSDWFDTGYGYDLMFRLEGPVEPPPPCEWETVFFEDFEGGFGNWVWDGLWNDEYETDTCGSYVAPFPSSDTAAWYGIDGVCTYNNGAANAGSIAMGFDLDLSAAVDAEIVFWSYEETECGGDCSYDNRYVEYSTDGGGSWTTIGEGYTEYTWYEWSGSMMPASGGAARVRFRFDTVDSIGNDYFGWMVDNVAINACFPTAEDTMHVADIQGYTMPNPGGFPALVMGVRVVDGDDIPLGEVFVEATIWIPEDMAARTRYSLPNGWARFWAPAARTGNYQICVDNLTLAGYTYNPDDNFVTCMDWDL